MLLNSLNDAGGIWKRAYPFLVHRSTQEYRCHCRSLASFRGCHCTCFGRHASLSHIQIIGRSTSAGSLSYLSAPAETQFCYKGLLLRLRWTVCESLTSLYSQLAALALMWYTPRGPMRQDPFDWDQ